MFVHGVVAEAFLGVKPKGLQVNHKDSNKENNASSNLEFVTPARNRQHAAENGLYPLGENHKLSKLKLDEIKDIRRLASLGLTYIGIARIFKVDPSTVRDIVIRETWKHVA